MSVLCFILACVARWNLRPCYGKEEIDGGSKEQPDDFALAGALHGLKVVLVDQDVDIDKGLHRPGEYDERECFPTSSQIGCFST